MSTELYISIRIKWKARDKEKPELMERLCDMSVQIQGKRAKT